MKNYYREVTVREPVNRFGKLGFKPVAEFVRTDDIAPYNKYKKIRFVECNDLRYMPQSVDIVERIYL